MYDTEKNKLSTYVSLSFDEKADDVGVTRPSCAPEGCYIMGCLFAELHATRLHRQC